MKRDELLKSLEIVGYALATDNLVPMWQNYMFQNNTVLAYNNSIGIVGYAKIDDEFACHGDTLVGLVRASTGETIDLKIIDNDLTIKSGRSTFKLPWMKKADFLFEEPKGEWAIKLPINDALLIAVDACLRTASKDLTQRALATICLTRTAGKLMLYSCNGDAVTACPLGDIKNNTSSYLMPTALCKAIIRAAKETETTSGELLLNDEWACAELAGFTLYGQLIQKSDSLDHAKLIKDTVRGEPTFVPIPEGLRPALQRAMVVTERETAPTVLTVEAGRLKLLSQTKLGTVRDSIAVPSPLPPVTASVSASMLNDALELCTEIAILENCCVLKGDKLSVLLSNMG